MEKVLSFINQEAFLKSMKAIVKDNLFYGKWTFIYKPGGNFIKYEVDYKKEGYRIMEFVYSHGYEC